MKIKPFFMLLCALSGSLCLNGKEVQKLSVYPTPHQVTLSQGALSIAGGFAFRGAETADKEAVALLESYRSKSGVKFYIGEQGDAAVKSFRVDVPKGSGSYYLKVSPKEIVLIGADARGTFYGVQTLLQLIEDDKSLPLVEIVDYPDVRFRGTVEGFYGRPWSHTDRLSQFKFYGQVKMDTYIYGPKDDPYHSSPNWRKPYPEKEAKQIQELIQAAHANKVDFIWAIHPGQDIRWNDEDFNNLISKFEAMYALGVRSYAVFFDDISGAGTDPHRQAELLNRIHNEFVVVKGDVTPLVMCPTEYNKAWANPAADGYLHILGDNLHPSIEVMWTGDNVIGDVTAETLRWVNSRIKRPSYMWWNYPVTDYVRNYLFMGPAYGLEKGTKKELSALVSNPMENAEASKVALLGIADYAWNIEKYDSLATWEVAVERLMPQAPEAFRTFCMHSSDLGANGHGFHRNESWEVRPAAERLLRSLSQFNFAQTDADQLRAEYQRMVDASATLLKTDCNKALIEEIKPWLWMVAIIGEQGLVGLDMIKALQSDNRVEYWNLYNNLLTLRAEADRIDKTYNQNNTYPGVQSAVSVMRPFVENVSSILNEVLYQRVSGEKLKKGTPIFHLVGATSPADLELDLLSPYFYHGKAMQSVGDWVGVDLGASTLVKNIEIVQGEKDTDRWYFYKALLEYSADGEQWNLSGDTIVGKNIVRFQGAPFTARYVRLRNVGLNPVKNYRVVYRRFAVNEPKREATLMTSVEMLAGQNIQKRENRWTISQKMEVVQLPVGGVVGIELPYDVVLKSVNLDFGAQTPVVPEFIETSTDGKQWQPLQIGEKVRFVRYINKGGQSQEMILRKFEVQAEADFVGGVEMLSDGDFATSYKLNGTCVVPLRADSPQAVSIFAAPLAGATVTVTAVDAAGKKALLGALTGSLTRFDLAAMGQVVAVELGSDREVVVNEVVCSK